MRKNEKGITLVSLIIVIAIMTIISTTVVNLSLKRFEINRLKKMYTDIELLQDKVSNYYLKYGTLPVLKNSSNTSIQYTYSSLNFEKNSEDNNIYYILDLSAIGEISLNYGKTGFNAPNTSKDVYIINEKSHIIYYVSGKKLNETTYHTLTNNISITDTIPPSSPEIKVVSGTKSGDVYTTKIEAEITAGKDGGSGVAGTQYSLDGGTTWETFSGTSKLIAISKNGTYTIKAKTYDNSSNYSEENILSIVVSKRYIWTQNKTIVTNGEVTLEVGQTVTGYDAGVSSYTDGWAVLGAENGKLLLVSKANVSSLSLSGKDGYNNGISSLNAACATYLNSSLADEARSIKVEDINRVTGYDPESTGDGTRYGAGNPWQYGNTVTITKGSTGIVYTSKVATGDDASGHTEQYHRFEHVDGTVLTTSNSIDVTSNAYCYYPNTLTDSSTGTTKGIETTSNAYKVLFRTADGLSGDTYWLASQCTRVGGPTATFTLLEVMGGCVNWFAGLWHSVERGGL